MLARRLQRNLEMPEQALVTVPDSESLRRCAAGIEEGLFQIRAHNQLDVFLFNLEVMDRKRDAVVGLLRSVLVPTISDWQAVSLPNGLYPLYYLLRPMRLAAEYSAALGQWIRTRKRSLMKTSPLPVNSK